MLYRLPLSTPYTGYIPSDTDTLMLWRDKRGYSDRTSEGRVGLDRTNNDDDVL
jgi:hypothetical protein